MKEYIHTQIEGSQKSSYIIDNALLCYLRIVCNAMGTNRKVRIIAPPTDAWPDPTFPSTANIVVLCKNRASCLNATLVIRLFSFANHSSVHEKRIYRQVMNAPKTSGRGPCISCQGRTRCAHPKLDQNDLK